MEKSRPEDIDFRLRCGARIRRLRIEGSVPMSAITERLTVTQSAISQWERGRSLPTRTNREMLAQILGAPFDEASIKEEPLPDEITRTPTIKRQKGEPAVRPVPALPSINDEISRRIREIDETIADLTNKLDAAKQERAKLETLDKALNEIVNKGF